MKIRDALFIGIMLFSVDAYSQLESYSNYRKQMTNDFRSFRNGVINNYASFLDGVWERYDTYKPIKRDKVPKPVVLPNAEQIPQSLQFTDITPQDFKATPLVTVPVQKPNITIVPPKGKTVDFIFGGKTLKGPQMSCVKLSTGDNKDIATVWRTYQKSNVKEIITILQRLSISSELNDWFTFLMVQQYANAIVYNGNNSDKVVLQHFLLANMGFDVRIARGENQIYLLVPFKQQVYERSYMTINNQKYYIFNANNDKINDVKYLYSCVLPTDAYCGETLDLLYNCKEKIEYGEYKARCVSDGVIEVTISVNNTLMEMLRHYPQMDVPEYARSSVDPILRNQFLTQMANQIRGLSQEEAANKIIHFVQYAFDYATDEEQHGYEKTYFLEENFYYQQNDCEDRSIIYAYLIRELLGLEVHLIKFPGHECTAVHFVDSRICGDGYVYKGKRFIICDPTYIGAKIGMCMPNYKNTKPIVELW